MQVKDVIRTLMAHSGMSGPALSAACGRSSQWAYNICGRSSTQLGTVVDVADVAGVDVVLVDRATGERLGVVDPPRRARPD